MQQKPKTDKIYKNLYKPTFPESTINLTPSIVTDVSAMFVDTIHFLTPSGEMSNTWEQKTEINCKKKMETLNFLKKLSL